MGELREEEEEDDDDDNDDDDEEDKSSSPVSPAIPAEGRGKEAVVIRALCL